MRYLSVPIHRWLRLVWVKSGHCVSNGRRELERGEPTKARRAPTGSHESETALGPAASASGLTWLSSTLYGQPASTRPLSCELPVESELEDVDAEHGLTAVVEVVLLVVLGHGHLVLLVPRLLLLQFLGLLQRTTTTTSPVETGCLQHALQTTT